MMADDEELVNAALADEEAAVEEPMNAPLADEEAAMMDALPAVEVEAMMDAPAAVEDEEDVLLFINPNVVPTDDFNNFGAVGDAVADADLNNRCG